MHRPARLSSRLPTALHLLGCVAALGGVAVQAQPETERSITHLAGDVYRFRNNGHYSVFMVTPEGAVVTDPISPDAAAWLNAEIQTRFNQPVKYVLYSHDHWDHVAGAAAFPDATIVAHANAVPWIAASDQPIEPPDLTFNNEFTLQLGGKEVRLYYLGRSHSDNLVYMLFPEEKILFGVDAIAVNRLPFQDFADTDIDGLIGSMAALEQMDVEIVAPGHGAVGTLADIAAHREYIELLKDQVTALLRTGRSTSQIKAAVTMPEYSHWESYEAWQQLNVDGMIRYVKSNYFF